MTDEVLFEDIWGTPSNCVHCLELTYRDRASAPVEVTMAVDQAVASDRNRVYVNVVLLFWRTAFL